MKERVLVMNGQRIVQTEREGGWSNQKVDKAGTLKPGIYNLYTSKSADKAESHSGIIVQSDAKSVYQMVGKSFVVHERSCFDKVPEIGSAKTITYSPQGKAVVAAQEPKLERALSR